MITVFVRATPSHVGGFGEVDLHPLPPMDSVVNVKMHAGPTISVLMQNVIVVGKAGTKVQSIIMHKTHFTRAEAVAWVKAHGFHSGKVDETSTSFRFRQFNPSRCASGPRTIQMTAGVSAVICVPTTA